MQDPLLSSRDTTPVNGISRTKMDVVASLVHQSGGTDPAVAHGEDTPAYAVLQACGLLNTSYRKDEFDDIFEAKDLVPNSSRDQNFKKQLKWGVHWTPGCGFMIYVS